MRNGRERGQAARRISIATAIAVAVALTATVALGGCGGGGRSSTGTGAGHPSPAASVQTKFISVVKTVSPQVVEVRTSEGLGSGVVYDTRGDIVTNAHVVGADPKVTIRLSDGSKHSGTVVGSAPGNDLAVVQLSGLALHPATFADSSRVQVGELALAIGNPLGLVSSVTEGIVSSTGRSVSEPNGVTLNSAIQTSAAINPGNSGGALVNLSGQVIGIPTLAATDLQLGGGAAPGIGFAIASNTVRQVANQLIAGAASPSGR
jgi:S1-C subfamily serine protease